MSYDDRTRDLQDHFDRKDAASELSRRQTEWEIEQTRRRLGLGLDADAVSIPDGAEGLRQYRLNFIRTSKAIDDFSKDTWCKRLGSMDLRSDCTAEIGGLLKDVEGFHEDVMRGASLPWDELEEATDTFLKDLELLIMWLDARHGNEIT